MAATKRSKGLKVKVIGCGGIGSWLVDPLCTLLAYSNYPTVEVSLIDGDTYEERNRERQNFMEIGPKATVTAQRLREKFPRLLFWDHPTYLTDANIVQPRS
jgi:tRNA A37 threonylcarbamoyladenosine dehydratase